MSKIILDKNSTSFNPLVYNENFRKIESEFNKKAFYRDNPVGEPNSLITDLDANSNKIYNLPKPILNSEAFRLQDALLMEMEIIDKIKGPKGDKGDKGDTGPQGAVGPPGPQGEKGDTGDQGLQGPVGPKGDIGETGPQGIQGLQGIPGEQGPEGPQGLKGDTGLQGEQGIQGIQGEIGPEGPQGPIGLTGPKGDQGEVGPPGTTVASGVSFAPTATVVATNLQAAVEELDTKKVPTTRQVIAGNGLTGGGTLAANRTFTLGTPSTLGSTTTNAVTTTSHTHALNVVTSPTDITVGRLLTVGSFGVGIPIIMSESAPDLNTYTTSGIYSTTQNATASNGVNYPIGVAGILEVSRTTNTTPIISQRYTVYNVSRVFIRSSYNGTWSAWVEVFTTSNLTYSQLSSLLVTNTTLTPLTGWTGPLTAINKIGRVKIKGSITASQRSLAANTTLLTAPIGFRPLVPYYLDVWYQGGTGGFGVAVARININGTLVLLEPINNTTTLNITGDWDIE